MEDFRILDPDNNSTGSASLIATKGFGFGGLVFFDEQPSSESKVYIFMKKVNY